MTETQLMHQVRSLYKGTLVGSQFSTDPMSAMMMHWQHSRVSPDLREKRKVGCQPYTYLFCCKKYCSPIRLQYFKFSRWSGYIHNIYQYTNIHNYYMTVQNKSKYRAGTRAYIDPFFAKVGLHPRPLSEKCKTLWGRD